MACAGAARPVLQSAWRAQRGQEGIRICACSADRADDPTTGGSLRQGLANIATAACGTAAAIHGEPCPAFPPAPVRLGHPSRPLHDQPGRGRAPGQGSRPVQHAYARSLPRRAEVRPAARPAEAAQQGGGAPYMPAVMIGRLRGIEVTDLTDAHHLATGLMCERRKGSLDSITPWNRELRWAWAWLRRYRSLRTEAHKRPVPLRPAARRLLVTQSGTPLARSTLKTAWQRLIVAAIDAGVIAAEDRFNLHGLKHIGITDTPRHARGQTRWRRPRKPGDDGALRPLGADSGGTEAAAGEARQSGLEPVEPCHLAGDLAGAKKKGLQPCCKPLILLAPEVGLEPTTP